MTNKKEASYSILTYFSDAYSLAKHHYWILLFNSILYFLIMLLLGATVIGFLAFGGLSVSLTKFWLKVARKEKVHIGDSVTFGFHEHRWLKSLGYFLISTLIRLVPIFIMIIVILLGHVVPSLHEFISGFYVFAALIAFFVLLSAYLTTIWAYGLYFLAEKNISVSQMFSMSHELIKTVGFWKALIIFFIIGLVPTALLHIPYVGFLLVFFITPYLFMVPVAIYVKHIAVEKSE